MSKDDFPNTEKGSNWSVAVLKCPRGDWTRILSDLFRKLEHGKENLIPHFKIEWYEKSNDSFFVSVRILRNPKHERLVRSQAEELLKDYPHEIDPEESSSWRRYNSWIKHGDRNPKWTRERCQILSKISRFALEIINANTSEEDRLEWAHLLSNMIAIFDYEKCYLSPEIFPNTRLLMYHSS